MREGGRKREEGWRGVTARGVDGEGGVSERVRAGNASHIVEPVLTMHSQGGRGMAGEGRRARRADGPLTVMGEGWAAVESNDRRTRHSDAALLCDARRRIDAPPLYLHVSGDRDEPGRERHTVRPRPDEVLERRRPNFARGSRLLGFISRHSRGTKSLSRPKNGFCRSSAPLHTTPCILAE